VLLTQYFWVFLITSWDLDDDLMINLLVYWKKKLMIMLIVKITVNGHNSF